MMISPPISSCTQSNLLALSNTPPLTMTHPRPLHDALPISEVRLGDLEPLAPGPLHRGGDAPEGAAPADHQQIGRRRSEEHTSELQSRFDIVCRRLLGKKHGRPHGY